MEFRIGASPTVGSARLLYVLATLVASLAITVPAASAADPGRGLFPEPPNARAAAEEPRLDTVTRPDGTEIVAGEVLVKFEPGATSGERSAAIQSVEPEESRALRVEDVRLIELEPGTSVGQAAAELREREDVAWAQPNHYYRALATPNDPLFNQLWGMKNTGQVTWPGPPQEVGTPGMDINVTPVWDWMTGTEGTRVAVIDSGIYAKEYPWGQDSYNNPDIFPNVNQELSRNFVWPGDLDESEWYDSAGHGTHVAGTIAAQGNNGMGVAGVNWDADVIAVRVLDLFGGGTDEWIANGIDYAGDIGSRVGNLSLGGEVSTPLVAEAIASHPDTLYVMAAGNGGADEIGDDVDVNPTYPCTIDGPNTLCVAALASNGSLPSWSNYGDQNVHLGAPGHDVLSTVPTNSMAGEYDPPYAKFSGTSMATPHVSGVATLAFAAKPSATVTQVRNAILDTVTPTPSLAGKTITGGRVNATAAIESLVPPNETQCTLPNGTVYKATWRQITSNSTIDVKNLLKKSPGSSSFVNFADFWGDVAKMEWWTPNTLNEMFIQSGQWGNPDATTITNAWDYAYWWAAVDQRPDVLATNPFLFLGPRISFRTNGSGLARDADVCNLYLGDWPEYTGSGSGQRTAVLGDSMVVQMAKKLLNQPGWRPVIEPQAKSSYATMRGEIRGLAAGKREMALGSPGFQYRPDVMVMTLGTRDADAIGALSTPAARTAALNTFKSNVDGALADSSLVPCRIVVTAHETGWKADGSYSAPQLQARKDVNAKLRAVASASSSVDIVDWAALSAGHEAHQATGRWYEVADRDNPNAAGLTALSNAIISKAQGSCS